MLHKKISRKKTCPPTPLKNIKNEVSNSVFFFFFWLEFSPNGELFFKMKKMYFFLGFFVANFRKIVSIFFIQKPPDSVLSSIGSPKYRRICFYFHKIDHQIWLNSLMDDRHFTL
jgi:hypothetical protein